MPAASPDDLYGPSGCPATATSIRTAPPTRWPGRRATSVSRSDPDPCHRHRARPDRRSVRCTPTPARWSARSWSTPRASGARVSAMVGVFTPSIPSITRISRQGRAGPRAAARHAVLPRQGQPRLRQGGVRGVLFGGYEANAPSRWEDGARGSTAARCRQRGALRAADGRRSPAGPVPGRRGDGGLVCSRRVRPTPTRCSARCPACRASGSPAGLSLNGFGGAGGIGKAIAEWITRATEVDVSAYRAWRFGDTYRDRQFAASAARETSATTTASDTRSTPTSGGVPAHLRALRSPAGAGRGVWVENGWERADYQPGRPWRRAGADQRAFGWTAPPYLDRLRAEHTAFRERAGIIDMTSFGKTAVEDPGRCSCSSALLRTRRPARRRRRLHADARRTRRDPGRRHGHAARRRRFRVVSGAGAVDADRGWLENSRRPDDPAVTIRDAWDETAVIGLWGPAAREILQATTRDDVSSAAFRFRTAREIPTVRRRCSHSGSCTSASSGTSSTSSRGGPCRRTIS